MKPCVVNLLRHGVQLPSIDTTRVISFVAKWKRKYFISNNTLQCYNWGFHPHIKLEIYKIDTDSKKTF